MKKRANSLITWIFAMLFIVAPAMGADFNFTKIDFTTFTIPNVYESIAYGINNNGIVVGKFLDDDGWHGFILDQSGPSITILNYPDANVIETVATGINEDGDVVGYFRKNDSSQFGFHYAGSAYKEIKRNGALATSAYDINNETEQEVAGTFMEFENGLFKGYGFIYDLTTEDFTKFNEGRITSGLGINDNGETVGSIWQRHPPGEPYPSYDQFGYHRDEFGTVTKIKFGNIPPCFYTDTYDINNNGAILGNYSCYMSPGAGVPAHGGFVYESSAFDVINLLGTPVSPAPIYWRFFGINDDGDIVGTYMDFNGWHAFTASPAGP